MSGCGGERVRGLDKGVEVEGGGQDNKRILHMLFLHHVQRHATLKRTSVQTLLLTILAFQIGKNEAG